MPTVKAMTMLSKKKKRFQQSTQVENAIEVRGYDEKGHHTATMHFCGKQIGLLVALAERYQITVEVPDKSEFNFTLGD